jgi:hypothetical protein
MRTILLVSAAMLALVACHKAPGADTGASSGAPSSAGPTPASGTMPHRKPGLWEQTMSHDGKTNIVGKISMCLDATTDAQMSMFGERFRAAGDCQKSVNRGLDGSYAFTSTCKMGQAGTITSKGTVSGDFQSSYKVHSESDTSGAAFAAMNGHHVTEIDATWAGPCPAGVSPGDMTVNGMTMNINKMMAAGAGAGAAKP